MYKYEEKYQYMKMLYYVVVCILIAITCVWVDFWLQRPDFFLTHEGKAIPGSAILDVGIDLIITMVIGSIAVALTPKEEPFRFRVRDW